MTELPGARADWEILTTLARMLGLSWAYLSPADILREIGRVAPIYAGVTRRALGESGLQWPLRPGEVGADGRTTTVGSETLTWPLASELADACRRWYGGGWRVGRSSGVCPTLPG